jgi:hypothetical protein
VKDRNLLKRLERLERILGSPVSAKEQVLRSTPWHVLEELEGLLEAGEVAKAGRVWERAAAGRYVVAAPVASRESRGAGAAPGPPEPPERSEEPPVAQEELAAAELPVELDGGPVDPDAPRPEMVAAPPNTGPRVVHGHAINLEAVEEQQPEPRPEIVRAPERPRLGPDAF